MKSCLPLNRTATALLLLLLLTLGLFGAATQPARARFDIYKYPASLIPESSADPGVDWSQYAYTQYVTDDEYLCNSVMVFEALHRLGSKADRVMMYPHTMHSDDPKHSKEAELLHKARRRYNVKLLPVHILRWKGQGFQETWAESYTKLLAFNQTAYKRVLNIDSDATILKNMDELFLLPSTPVAMPKAYWGNAYERSLSSQLMLIEPSDEQFARVVDAILTAPDNTYDMDIVNDLYGGTGMVLPHRPYNLISGEFRRRGDHAAYLGTANQPWDPDAVLAEAKFVHFSDWPVAKPWIQYDEALMTREQPRCVKHIDGTPPNCRGQRVWRGLYENFRHRRKNICDMPLAPPGSKNAKGGAGQPKS